ncbi:MAG: hypothetical protein JWO39_1545, partial [Gemmatimonadetes bacterium]|nr:hypothetical protein [Gemmatimonadota bacterium]
VTISIIWLRALGPQSGGPAPAPRQLTTPYRPDGTFSLTDVPKREGRYRALAISPDGTGRDSIEFSVTDGGAYAASVSEVVKADLDVASDEVDEIIRNIEAEPDSPAKRDAMQQLPELKAALAGRGAAVQGFHDAIINYVAIFSSDPRGAPTLTSAYSQLGTLNRQSFILQGEINQALRDSRKANLICDKLIPIEEGFKLLNTMFTLMSGYKAVLGFFGNTTLKMQGWKSSLPELSTKAKAGAFAYEKFMGALPGIAAKVSGRITVAVFDHYCQKFEGPVNGSMLVQYFSQGEQWWQYTINIEGVMTLAYRKDSDPSQPVALKGHLYGTGTKFTVKERALEVLQRKLLQGGIVAGRTTAPLGVPFTRLAGAMALQAAPTAFFIPVEAVMQNGKLKVTINAARLDFNSTYTMARGGYVVGGPLSMNVVYFTTFEVPFDNAHGLIEKATNSDLGPVEIPNTDDKKQMTAEKSFTETRSKVKAKGVYDLSIKLCNPGC